MLMIGEVEANLKQESEIKKRREGVDSRDEGVEEEGRQRDSDIDIHNWMFIRTVAVRNTAFLSFASFLYACFTFFHSIVRVSVRHPTLTVGLVLITFGRVCVPCT